MAISISIRDVTKKYGETTVLSDLTLEIESGELFTLLGPSGCGKTTLLRMIAGFNSIEGGGIYFNDRLINDVDPSRRNIGMVFQNYAIFPHLTVRKNVEFGLRNMGLPRTEIRERAEQYIELVQIDRWKDEMPDRLSGGQQQRVALARALVTNPDVLLMDEPLSNLDAKLRVEMRDVIRDIQKRIGITTVYVTHDQEEAMAVSDRIAVMREGKIQQLGVAPELYHRPANEYVASFIGRTNLLTGQLTQVDGMNRLTLAEYTFPIPDIIGASGTEKAVMVAARPEHFFVQAPGDEGIRAEIVDSVFLGRSIHQSLRLPNGTVVEVVEDSELEVPTRRGAEVVLGVKANQLNLFDPNGSRNLSGVGQQVFA